MSEPGAASQASSSSGSQASSCLSEFSASLPPLSYHSVPQELLYRITEYDDMPVGRYAEWQEAHRRLPCVLRQSHSYLWSPPQRTELGVHFYSPQPAKPGWRDDPASPILSFHGSLYPSTMDLVELSSYPRWEEARAASRHSGADLSIGSRKYSYHISLGAALHRHMLNPAHPYVMTDMKFSQHDFLRASAAALRDGPALFAPNNLLSLCPQDLDFATQDHSGLQLIVANRGGDIPAQCSQYGTDLYSHLIEGQMIWFLAPGHSGTQFRSLFAQSIPLQSLSPATTAAYRKHQVMAVVQNAGDTLYLPAGWWYCCKSLTDTVSLSGLYLRPWNLRLTLDFIQSGLGDPTSQYNLPSVFNFLNAKGQSLGVPKAEAQQLCSQWDRLVQEIEHPQLVGSDSDHDQ